jgi:tetratricopeptide (TPR) repeat protein
MRHACVVLVVCLLSSFAITTVAQESKLSDECVGSDATRALSCSGTKKSVPKRRALPGMKPEKKHAKKTSTPPPAPPIPDRDPRATKKKRSLALLISEATRLDGLVRVTARNAPDRQQLMRRLADDYAEIEGAKLSAVQRLEVELGAALRKRNTKLAGRLRSEISQAKKYVTAMRASAIKTYAKLANEYPNSPKLDEALYYLAYEHEQAGDLSRARKVYYELIQKTPTSPFVPRAYLAFGELFFSEAMGDPSKWGLAEAAYKQVLGYPPPNNKVYGIARYKLAYVFWNQEKLPEALNELTKVIQFATAHATLPSSKALEKNARRDIVTVYAQSGAAEKAWTFFQKLSGNRTTDVLNELGVAYLDIGRYSEAVALYRQLGERDAGARSCHYQTQVSHAVQAWKSGDKTAISSELVRQLAARESFRKSDVAAKDKTECDNRTAELLTETAMAWHLEAVGSGGVRGTRDPSTMDRASELYERVVKAFSAEDFARFSFPRFVRADWPTLARVQYARADLAYERGRFADCARAFDAVFASDPKGNDAPDAAYGALLCYQKLRDQLRAGRSDRQGQGLGPASGSVTSTWSKLAPRPLDELEKNMVAAFDRYLCWLTPPSGDKAARDQEVEVEFARARTYYEARHWEEAALAFRHIALTHPEHDAGIYAAQLYLESMNVLATRAEPRHRACLDDMANDVPLFVKSFCGSGRSDVPKDQCDILARVDVGLERTQIEDLVARADKLPADSSEAMALYQLAAERYRKLWRERCDGKTCEKGDEILHNMARAYQAGRLMGKAILAREMLLDPKNGYEATTLAQKALWELAANHQALAVYDRAAELYERYVEKTCKAGKCGELASSALYDAAMLRLGLADPDHAIENARRFDRWFGRTKAKEAAELRFAVAAHYASRQAWGEVVKKLGGALGAIDKHADLDIRLQAHALLGRARAETKDRRGAAREFDVVLSAWKDPQVAAAQIEKLDKDPAIAQRRLGRALESVGEALYFLASQKKARVDAVPFPLYKGPGTKAAVLGHIGTKVKDWIQTKRPLIEDATRDYERIVQLQPSVPPRWAIAAGADVGEMWGTFVKEFRQAPIPDSIKNDVDLRNAYYGEIDRVSEPQKKLAKRAYETCLGYSATYQYWDTQSRSCEEWLSRNFKSEYHLVDEFRGTPTRRNDALRELARPARLVSKARP